MQVSQGEPLHLDGANGSDEGVPPEWAHLMPMGKTQGKDGRGPYLLTDAQAVINATRRYLGSGDMPIDYEHQILRSRENGQPAPAAGWVKELQAREDGIWGRVEWTAQAAKRLRSKEYRYLSPVFMHLKDGTVTRLACAALTNTPNLELKALASTSISGQWSIGTHELSPVEIALCSRMGVSQADFLRERLRENTSHAASVPGISPVEQHICSCMGISEEKYLEFRDS